MPRDYIKKHERPTLVKGERARRPDDDARMLPEAFTIRERKHSASFKF